MTGDTTASELRGLGSLTLENFRGWVGEHALDTDADVVLLTGANGCGKSSLLEAVNLLVNGHYFDLENNGTPDDAQLATLASGGHRCFKVAGNTRGTAAVLEAWLEIGAKELSLGGDYWTRYGKRKDPPPPDLLARATTYFQERIDFILRDLSGSKTLRQFLTPLPPVVETLRKQIEDLPDEINKIVKDGEQELDSDQAPAPAFCQGAEGFRKAWQDLRDEEPRLELPAAPEGLDQDQTKFAAAVATWLARTTTPEDDLAGFGRLLAAAVAQINRRIEGLSAGAKESRRGKLLEERDALRSKRDKLDSDHPRDETALVLAQFAGDEQTGLPGLHQVLRGVEAHLTHWRELAPGLPSTESLRPLLDELNQLDQGTAGVLRACLEQWLAPWQEADDARGRIQKRLDEIDEQLAQTLPVADTGPLQRALDQWKYSWDGETKRRRGFAEAEGKRAKIEARRALARALTVDPNESPFTAVQPLDDKVRAELAKALDQTLCRFQFDAGFLPVRPHDAQRKRSGGAEVQGYQLQTRDGRPSHVFSTGQKGQVALAYMLAQALLLRAELPHRVLVLDDTSTAFDLGNIVRQATWLRQLAYSAKAQYRWQIFVASHHEELTNRLIELLVPPEGRELRLIRFLRWSPETGPEIEQHRARQNPNLAGDDGASLCEGIAKRLQRSWPALRVAEHG